MKRPISILTCALILLLLLLSGCANEELPPAETLTLREWLGLDAAHLSTLSEEQQGAFLTRLEAGWNVSAQESPTGKSLLLPQELRRADSEQQWPLDFIRVEDAKRALQSQHLLASGRLDAKNTLGEITPLQVTPSSLGLTLDGDLTVRPLSDDEITFDGHITFDESWGREVKEALEHHSERERIAELEPVFRRFLGELEVDASEIQIVAARQAPLVIWYASEHHAVLFNPNLLYLLGPIPQDEKETAKSPKTSSASAFFTQSHALELDFIEACVEAEIARCDACLSPTPPESCRPQYSSFDRPPEESIREECRIFSRNENEGFSLHCYNLEIQSQIDCLLDASVERICGLERAPVEDPQQLWLIRPMMFDPLCQYTLQNCHGRPEQGGFTPRPPFEPSGLPIADGSWEGSNDTDLLLFCDIIDTASSCDDAGDEISDDDSTSCGSDSDTDDSGACESDDDDAYSDSSDSSLCQSDDIDDSSSDDSSSDDSDDSGGGLCDDTDDTEAEASLKRSAPIRGGDLFMALAFALLFGVWLRNPPADLPVDKPNKEP